MSSTARSPATRRRKRDTTSKAVDFLNNLNSSNRTASHTLRRPTRTPRTAPIRQPRSDDIWNIPESPELTQSRFAALSQSVPHLTPRRSARLQQPSPSAATPTRRSVRVAASSTPKDHNPTQTSDPTDNERSTEVENGESTPSGQDDALPRGDLYDFSEVQLFSDDSANATHMTGYVQQPSPSVFADRILSSSPSRVMETQDLGPPDDLSQEGSDASALSSQFHTPEPDTRQTLVDISRSARHGMVLESVVVPARQATPIHVEPSSETAESIRWSQSPDIPVNKPTRATRNKKPIGASQPVNTVESPEAEESTEEPTEEPTGDAEMAEPSSESSFAQPDSSSESSDSSDSDEDELLHRPISNPASSASFRSSPDLPAQNSSLIAPSDKLRRHNSHTEEDESDASDDFWFVKAKSLGDQDENWSILVHETRRMQRLSKASVSGHFTNIKNLVTKLQAGYQEAVSHYNVHGRVSKTILHHCAGYLQDIRKKADGKIHHIYYQAIKSEHRSGLGEMLDDFEARVIAAVARRILVPCFELYYKSHGRSVPAREHLAEVIRLLRHLCDAAYSLTVDNHVHGVNASARLRRPLRELAAVLESGGLERREWSDEEGNALLEGLQRYLGHDRYRQIRWKYRLQLSKRTIQDIQARAKLTYERLLPTIEDEVQTPAGRREWGWLLSVGDDSE